MFDKITGMFKNFSNIIDIFDSIEKGSVVFTTPGDHCVEVETRYAPRDVWVSLVPGNMAVCQGNLDKVSWTLTPTGFMLYAEVVSDQLQVKFVADF